VGAVIVGRITITALPGRPSAEPGLHPVAPAKSVARGDEIGMFHLGSTAVVLLEPGLSVGRPLGKVRFGESLLRAG
jgi:phosphatidylserine decarboxylase